MARGPLPSIDEEEDIYTVALGRDELDAARFAMAASSASSASSAPGTGAAVAGGPRAQGGMALQGPALPVPHFRSAAEARAHRHAPEVQVKATATTAPSPQGAPRELPLRVWFVAAMIAAIVSYNLTPPAVASVANVVRGAPEP
jgi:hypothetical protein